MAESCHRPCHPRAAHAVGVAFTVRTGALAGSRVRGSLTRKGSRVQTLTGRTRGTVSGKGAELAGVRPPRPRCVVASAGHGADDDQERRPLTPRLEGRSAMG